MLSDLSKAKARSSTAGIQPHAVCPCPLLATPLPSWLGHICPLNIRPRKWGHLVLQWSEPQGQQCPGDLIWGTAKEVSSSSSWSCPLYPGSGLSIACLDLSPSLLPGFLALIPHRTPPPPCCCRREFAKTQV